MFKQILLKIILVPTLMLLASAGVYYFVFMSDDGSVVQQPDGIYTQQIEDSKSLPDKPTTETPPPNQTETKQPTPPPTRTTSPRPASKPPIPAKQDPKLYAKDSDLYRELGRLAKYSTPSLALNYSSNTATNCKSNVAVGCYLPSQDVIWISSSFKTNESNRRDILAHEYMHYIWQHLDVGTASLKSTLTAKYSSSKELRAAIDDSYVVNGKVNPNEILAYSCTTLNERQMGSTIYSVCNKYLKLSLLSPFIKSSPSRLIGAINYLREKKSLAGISTNANLNKAAQASLDSIVKGNDLSSLKNNPNVTTNIRTACHVKQYNVNYLQTNASDEVYIAENITSSSKDFYFSNQVSAIGAAIKKIPYDHPKGASKPLVNSNVVVIISC